MDFVPVKSSNLDSIAFEAATSTLGVRFKNGSEYHYFNVPEHIYKGLLAAQSAGKYLNENVKERGYKYKQVR